MANLVQQLMIPNIRPLSSRPGGVTIVSTVGLILFNDHSPAPLPSRKGGKNIRSNSEGHPQAPGRVVIPFHTFL